MAALSAALVFSCLVTPAVRFSICLRNWLVTCDDCRCGWRIELTATANAAPARTASTRVKAVRRKVAGRGDRAVAA